MSDAVWARVIPIAPAQRGAINMAADYFLASELPVSEYNAVMRVYEWDPTAVSLGINQSSEIINFLACAERGWDVVRRPTGGRSLLHNQDLSFAVMIKSTNASHDLLAHVYNKVASALVSFFKEYHLSAEIVRSKSISSSQDYSSSPLRRNLCLDSRTRGEIVINGLKIAASSQRLFRNVVLQHGSIILTGKPSDIVDVMNDHDQTLSIAKSRLESQAVSLENVLGYIPNINELKELLIQKLLASLNYHIKYVDFTNQEYETIIEQSHLFQLHPLLRATN